MRRRVVARWGVPAATLAAVLAVIGAPVAAQSTAGVCASAPVSARGEPARFEVLARTKARANWRARVRALPGLGNPYSSWARAAQAEERCITGPAGTVCTFTGTPCR